VVIQQHSRKLLMMDILMSETCWSHKKWNIIASDIKLVFYSSTHTRQLDTLIPHKGSPTSTTKFCGKYDRCKYVALQRPFTLTFSKKVQWRQYDLCCNHSPYKQTTPSNESLEKYTAIRFIFQAQTSQKKAYKNKSKFHVLRTIVV